MECLEHSGKPLFKGKYRGNNCFFVDGGSWMRIVKAQVLAFWLPFYKETVFYFETKTQVPDGSW